MSELRGAEEDALGEVLDHEKLDVYKFASEFAALVMKFARNIDEEGAHLADQIRRSSSSIMLNIAEGTGRMSRPDKTRFYKMASGSASESAAALDLLFHSGLIELADYSAGKTLIRRIVPMLIALIRSVEKR